MEIPITAYPLEEWREGGERYIRDWWEQIAHGRWRKTWDSVPQESVGCPARSGPCLSRKDWWTLVVGDVGWKVFEGGNLLSCRWNKSIPAKQERTVYKTFGLPLYLTGVVPFMK